MSEFLPLKTQLIETGLNEEAVQSILKVAQETLQPKKYGLVWEEKEETTFMQQPCFKEIHEREIKLVDSDSPQHLLIEGDNYEALKLLQTTHRGKVDVIYIDPPYNTGNEFVYNDKLVDKKDGYRHSKWLSFMHKRLILAKELMSEDGVIFINIDEHEFAQLKLLCDEIFGEQNTEIAIWHKVGDGGAAAGKMKITKRIRREHEYLIMCYRNKNLVNFSKFLEKPSFKNEYKNRDNDPRGAFESGNISKTEEKSNPSGKNYYSVSSPTGQIFTRQWHFDLEEFKRLDADNRIYWGKSGSSVPRLKIFINEPRLTTPTSILSGVGSATSASKALREIFGHNVFENPKPLELIKRLIQISSDKGSTILDFFAGSGTTGHAILELNQEDGGNRQFILCTNNENNICEDVTYERLKRVMNGYTTPKGKEVEGLSANLKYLKIVDEETGGA